MRTYYDHHFTRDAGGNLTADASDLGNPMPDPIKVTNGVTRHVFRYLNVARDSEGEISYWRYVSNTGGTMFVFND